ncbi:HAF repeat-containing protein [Candidatus Chlamydia sanziniae]|uniref:Uncharacterized protein n=1 Tax=Candidatus Chlamydia sanziniae TaxID=1806891 RepID=A0A1A9HUD9_9CHLA|nr:HAF repeat-containing protein [Candidatus Chlamydia sanziniae]ANH78599.1 hypothetical protein Cs308_0428 [Candidatus Chlamydia sanziniae]
MGRNRLFNVFKLTVAFFLVAAVNSSFAHTLIDIGSPGIASAAWGVSGDGSVIIGEEGSAPFMYAYGQRTLLPTLGQNNRVCAISEDGSVIVGFSSMLRNVQFNITSICGVKWEKIPSAGYKVIELPLTSWGHWAEAYAVSADGNVIVGRGNDGFDTVTAVKWCDDRITWVHDFESLFGVYQDCYACANAVSGDGSVIVGVRGDNAMKWEGGIETCLGSLGDGQTLPQGISKDGKVIVGSSWTCSGQCHAFVYKDGVINDLGTLGGDFSEAKAVSGDGSIIIGASTTTTNALHAFQYVDGKMIDLGTLGGNDSCAHAISNDGKVIVGRAQTATGLWHAFLCYTTTETP